MVFDPMGTAAPSRVPLVEANKLTVTGPWTGAVAVLVNSTVYVPAALLEAEGGRVLWIFPTTPGARAGCCGRLTMNVPSCAGALALPDTSWTCAPAREMVYCPGVVARGP